MPMIIITHVGTSALESGKALKNAERHDPNPAAGPLLLNALRDDLTAAVSRNLSSNDALVSRWSDALVGCLKEIWDHRQPLQTRLQQTPAEINSLNQFGIQTHDRVVLVCSDTDEGKFCGRLLRGVLTSTRPNGFVPAPIEIHEDIDTLKGVDVRTRDAEAFVHSGLPAYMRIVAREYKLLQSNMHDHIVFNVTGGYKGIIPFATMAAQILNAHALHRRKITEDGAIASVVYVHEDSLQVVKLAPRLPIQWEGVVGLDQRLRNIREQVDTSGSGLPSDPFEAMLYELGPAIE
jgi:hypothetical protein